MARRFLRLELDQTMTNSSQHNVWFEATHFEDDMPHLPELWSLQEYLVGCQTRVFAPMQISGSLMLRPNCEI